MDVVGYGKDPRPGRDTVKEGASPKGCALLSPEAPYLSDIRTLFPSPPISARSAVARQEGGGDVKV